VQGQLRKEHLKADLATECAHCHAALDLTISSDLRINVRTAGAEPLVFEPEIDWHEFAQPNILAAY
jgi:hypothetical protein